MNKRNIIIWIILLILTIVAGMISGITLTYIVPLILILAALKFIGVAFSFMEIKKAHLFWKILLISYLVIFCGLVLVVL